MGPAPLHQTCYTLHAVTARRQHDVWLLSRSCIVQVHGSPGGIACAKFLHGARCTPARRWVPKIGRKYVKPADVCFYDIIEYDPDKLKAPPYRLNVTSELPLLGDKVPLCAMHACVLSID